MKILDKSRNRINLDDMDKKKLFIIGGIILAVIIIIVLILPKGQQVQTTDTIRSITLAKGVTSSREPIEPTNVFSTEDSDIYAVIDFWGLPGGTTVEYEWYDMTIKKRLQIEQKNPASDFTGKGLSSVKRVLGDLDWAVGDFEFRVYYNGVLRAVEEYMVRTPSDIEEAKAISSIKNIDLSTSVDLRGRATSIPKNTFMQDEEKIYASVEYKDTPKNTTFEAKWIYLEESKLIKSYKRNMTGSGNFAFSINAKTDSWLPIKKWPKGKYRLEIYLNDDLLKEVNFSVK